MGSRRDYLAKNIVDVCRKLDVKGFVANHDGNISAKHGDLLLATPTSEAKAIINEDMIITLDMEGKKIEGNGNPFSEIKLHLAAYRSRDDARAVVHAHPPFSMARGLVGKPLQINVPEAVVSIGDVIPVVPFAMPGAPENDDILAAAFQETDVVMMPGNGLLSIGSDVEQAWLRMELVEHLCKIDYYAMKMGTQMTLSAENATKLLEKRASIGLGPKGHIPKPATSTTPGFDVESLKSLIADEIRRALKG